MGLNINEMQNKKSRISGANWRPDEGANEVRILPPTSRYFDEDIDFFAHEFNMHFFRQEGFNTEVTRCPRDVSDYCPVCEVSAKFKDDDDPALKQMANDISRVQRFLMNLLSIDAPEDGIQTYSSGWTVWNGILSYLANPKWGDILNPADGHSVVIQLTPANKSRSGWNSYEVQPDPERTDVTSLLPDGWKDQLDELEAQIPESKSEDELVGILQRMGFPVEGSDVGAPKAKPAPAAAPKAKSEDAPASSSSGPRVVKKKAKAAVATEDEESE